mmetsp:Transcript_88608/g.153817  ORF Transcript_88608/g.153817 Transcript_88608/m.153817 type:complete len:110 (-) Transcript_88608:111-440(-)
MRVLHLKAKPSRAAAIKLDVAIDRNWRSAGTLRTRLGCILALPWNADRPCSTRNGQTKQVEPVVMDTTVPLTEPDLDSARILVAERWDMCNSAHREFHIIHYEAAQWIK